ncbi:MAG: argininosuccinate lyase [Clostridia bacterium]|nr:MAG: argininosuccinate lyase [Clostridia bacterium]
MKLWDGRFRENLEAGAETFGASIDFDQRLWRQDIRGSIAHARMLAACGLISREEMEQIVAGLESIAADLEAGQVELRREAEDIHMNIEELLTARIGEAGAKLHTARSRNDQVVLDLRLYAKAELAQVAAVLCKLQEVLLEQAKNHLDTLMPGYTHLQRAQPVTLAHHLLAYFAMLQRDFGRLSHAYDAADVCPLGAGALAATTLPINREMVARELCFSRVAENSLDAVSDRDFVLEFTGAACLIMMHLSRLAEEIILWATEEFGFVELPDAYSTGSSMMPQKKNPDVAELIRGKTGRVYGHHLALLTVLKGLPLAYNKDLQEDKEALFDTVDTVKACLEVCAGLLQALRFRREVMAEAAGGFTLATDLAEYLVRRGLPFRQAHRVVGRLVGYCLEQGRALADLTLDEYRRFSPEFGPDVLAVGDPRRSLERRDLPGGPAPEQVRLACARAREQLAGNRSHPMFAGE